MGFCPENGHLLEIIEQQDVQSEISQEQEITDFAILSPNKTDGNALGWERDTIPLPMGNRPKNLSYETLKAKIDKNLFEIFFRSRKSLVGHFSYLQKQSPY